MPGHPLRRALGTWWRDRSVGLRRIVRTLVLLLVSTLVCLGAGAVTATASSPVGPHQARWSTTLDSTLTVDLGPLGSASLDSPAGPLGVRVLLGEIPSDAATPGTDDLAALLTGDLGSYSSLAAHPDLTIRQGLRALRDDALRRAGLLESLVLCAVAAARLLTRGHLRDAVAALTAAARTHRRASVLGTATALAAAVAVVVPAVSPATSVQSRTLEVLAGTSASRARFSGRLADVVAAYGPQLTSYLTSTRAFYAQAADSLRSAWAQADAAEPVRAPDGDVASPSPTGSPASPTPRLGPVTAVLTTDLHCNLDVIDLVGVLDEVAGATVHMDDGDLTMTGSDPEQVCVDALSQAVPDGVSRVATIGNHDSAATAARLTAQGWTVTDGTVHQVGGLRVLGDTDPDRTTATGTTARGQEDVQALGARLAATSCRVPTDVVLVHQPAAFGPLAATGCAPLLIGGHLHSEQGLSATAGGRGTVLELVAGAGKGGTSIGAVTEDSYAHVLSFSRDGALLAWRTVVLHPDASVTVTTWQDVPTPS